MDVGRRVSQLRAAHGDSLRQASLRTGVSHSTIARIEKCKVNGSFDETLQKIAEGYNVPLDYVLGDQYSSSANSILLLRKLTQDERSTLLFTQGLERLRRAVALVTREAPGCLPRDRFTAALGIDSATLERILSGEGDFPQDLTHQLQEQLAHLTGLSPHWFRWSMSEGEIDAESCRDWEAYVRLAERTFAAGLQPSLVEMVIDLLRLGSKPEAGAAPQFSPVPRRTGAL